MAASRFPARFVLAVAAVGLAARLAFGLGFWVNQTLNRDESEYLSLARSLAAGDGFVFDEQVRQGPVEPFGRAPGYPVFLALTGAGGALPTIVPATVKIAQALAGAIGVVLIGAAAFRMAGPRPAIAAAAIAAIHPPLVWISGFAYSESIFWTVGILLAIVMSRTLEESRAAAWKWALLAGLIAGIAILIRAATLLFVPLAGGWLLWKRRPAAFGALVVGVALVLGPWTARNVAHYGRFVVVASDGGVTFWTGNNALAIGEGDMAANPQIKLASQQLRAANPELNEEQMEPIYYREAFGWIRAHPIDWAWLMARKVFYLVVPIGPSYTLHSPLYYSASVLSVGLLLPCAAMGLWRLGDRRRRLAGMWLLAAAAVATCLVFFPQERFRIPVLDPALILCASGLFVPGRVADAGAAAGRSAA